MASRPNPTFGFSPSGTDWVGESLAARAIAMVANRVAEVRDVANSPWVDRLVAAAILDDATRLAAVSHDLRSARIPAEMVVDQLIPAAARELGLWWETDRAGFSQVTIGSARLQAMLREHARSFVMAPLLAPHPGVRAMPPSILMVVPEHEQHMMGAIVASSQLTRAGYDTVLSLCEPHGRLRARLRTEGFTAVCLSLSRRETLETARNLVETIRMACARPVKVMIGGAAVSGWDHVGVETGADTVTNDLQKALRQCGLMNSVHGDGRGATRA